MARLAAWVQTQHMANLLAIASDGGLELHNGDRLIPERDRFRLEPRGHPRVNASST